MWRCFVSTWSGTRRESPSPRTGLWNSCSKHVMLIPTRKVAAQGTRRSPNAIRRRLARKARLARKTAGKRRRRSAAAVTVKVWRRLHLSLLPLRRHSCRGRGFNLGGHCNWPNPHMSRWSTDWSLCMCIAYFTLDSVLHVVPGPTCCCNSTVTLDWSSLHLKEKRKGKKGKKAKKSKKDKKGDKKETEKQREARLEKERKKAEKEQERNARKEKNQLLSKCKKAEWCMMRFGMCFHFIVFSNSGMWGSLD